MPPKPAKEVVKAEVPAEVVDEQESIKAAPEFGFGKFEYVNQATYQGNWKLMNGKKCKHGHGKMTSPGIQSGDRSFGLEEYDGDWSEDKMHGYGRYQYSSGAIYTGQWCEGMMHGSGKMVYADGTSYDGEWRQNLMHGEGNYIDCDKTAWEGIFVDGSFESKIQKKLKAEKTQNDRVNQVKAKVMQFFVEFFDAFAKSDKKTYKENMAPFFASADTCMDFVAEPYVKFDERPADKWNDLLKNMYDDGRV